MTLVEVLVGYIVDMHTLMTQFRYWTHGIRFYIALASVLVTIEVLWWGRAVFGDTPLATIRIQEAYAWISTGLLAAALMIGPVLKAFPALPGKQLLREARRMVGISAFWFGLLHALIPYFKQFNTADASRLPDIYQWSLLLGVVGLFILMLMAFTSFDGAMKSMGVWWFRLHRFVYLAALAILLHAFMIGAHATSAGVLIALAAVALLWIGLNIYLLVRSPNANFWRIIALSYGVMLLVAVLNYGLSQYLGFNEVISDHEGHPQ